MEAFESKKQEFFTNFNGVEHHNIVASYNLILQQVRFGLFIVFVGPREAL